MPEIKIIPKETADFSEFSLAVNRGLELVGWDFSRKDVMNAGDRPEYLPRAGGIVYPKRTWEKFLTCFVDHSNFFSTVIDNIQPGKVGDQLPNLIRALNEALKGRNIYIYTIGEGEQYLVTLSNGKPTLKTPLRNGVDASCYTNIEILPGSIDGVPFKLAVADPNNNFTTLIFLNKERITSGNANELCRIAHEVGHAMEVRTAKTYSVKYGDKEIQVIPVTEVISSLYAINMARILHELAVKEHKPHLIREAVKAAKVYNRVMFGGKPI